SSTSTSSSSTTSTSSSTSSSTSTSTSSTSSTSSSTSSTTSSTVPGGYHCYEVDFEPRNASVFLADDLLSAQVSTTKLWRLCNPAAINNQLAPKHRDHLLGYSLTSAASSGLGRVKGIEVIDQFGTSPNVEIVRRDLMMLPSAKSLDGPVSAIQNPE